MASITLRANLVGHDGAVTCLATSAQKPDTLFSGSRDKTVMIWNLTKTAETYGKPLRSLHGHSHFVQDIALSNDASYILSGSWDGTMRLWDIKTGKTIRRFVGHSKDVLSVAFSADNRQIISGSRDKTVRLWNTLGECKYTFEGHTEWVSCVRISPDAAKPLLISASWDKTIKIWDLANFKLRHTLVGHKGNVNTVAICPDGTICATAGKDGLIHIWDLAEDKHITTFETGASVNALAFSPAKIWLAAAVGDSVKIYDLSEKKLIAEFNKDQIVTPLKELSALSLAFSQDGNTLFVGYNDKVIRVLEIN